METLKENQIEIVELKNILYFKLSTFCKDFIVKWPQNNNQ